MRWDAEGYDRSFSFVTAHGAPLLDLLDPRPGERVLDVGCGTGHLTAEVGARGAYVEGVDADPAMVARARSEHPGLAVRLADARELAVDEPFDAVLSNATLHWVPERDQDAVLRAIRGALRREGRFVAEIGGAGNVAALVDAVGVAREAFGLPHMAHPWCFPTPAEQAARLETAGFRVRLLEHFDRPTPLADGDTAAGWVRMFGPELLVDAREADLDALFAEVDAAAAPRLRDAAGAWHADYVRLRWWAVAV